MTTVEKPASPKLLPTPVLETGAQFWEPEKEKDYLALPTTPQPALPTAPAVSTPNVATPTSTQKKTPVAMNTGHGYGSEDHGKEQKGTIKPGERLICLDTESSVLVTNSILLFNSICYLVWNWLVNEPYLAGLAGCIFLLCLTTFLNMFTVKSAACYVATATTMTIFLLVYHSWIGYKFYNTEILEDKSYEEMSTPNFEGVIVGLILVLGLLQLYRMQIYNDAMRFAERSSFRRFRNTIKSLKHSLKGPKPAATQEP